MVDPMSPRLASAMTSRPAVAGRGHHRFEGGHSARAPSLEERHLGLDHRHHTGERLHAAQAERAEPVGRVGQAPPSSRAGEGSMPAHSGPVRATAAADDLGETAGGRVSHGPLLGQFAHPADAVPRAPPFDLRAGSGGGARGSRKVAVPDLDGIGPGHQQLDGVLPAHHPAHPDDGGVGIRGPHVEDGPHGDRVDGRSRQPAAGGTRTQDRPAASRRRWPWPAPC